MKEQDFQQQEMKKILQKAKRSLPQLKELLAKASDHWSYEDVIYRFYHNSFKVYAIQTLTEEMVASLKELAPHRKLNSDFQKIIKEGTGQVFSNSHNEDWLNHTRPMIEAFFHARYMLEMVCKYAEKLEEPPELLPSGWASVLYLYNLR